MVCVAYGEQRAAFGELRYASLSVVWLGNNSTDAASEADNRCSSAVRYVARDQLLVQPLAGNCVLRDALWH